MKTRARPENRICLPAGFSFSATCAGIKASGRPDLALVEASPGTTAAALFTQNRIVAAPVEVGRQALAASRGRVRAVIVNSGNANCATGKAGTRACEQTCREVARLLGVRATEVFPSSTGIIGVPLQVDRIIPKLTGLVGAQEATAKAVNDFASAIMTTDKRPKSACAQLQSGDAAVKVLGLAKGAGMIHPQVATMLVYLFTDARASPAELKQLLRNVCDKSFNCISVDGDTSTNDTVLLLASGVSAVSLGDGRAGKRLSNALHQVCQSLAEQIVFDGEGVRHVIRLSVEQAKDRDEALRVARTVAHSLLAKTAWAGADPNWGRILAAVGRSGIAVNSARVSIFIDTQMVCHRGVAHAFNKQQAHQALARPYCKIRILLGRGKANSTFLTSDLTAEYVRINAEYST